MTNPIIIVPIAIVVVIIVGIGLRIVLPKRQDQKLGQAEYTEGLNLLISGDKQSALAKFRQTVKKNTDNIDAYIKIGDLLREMGRPEQAAKVHVELTVRSNITLQEQRTIWRSLMQDYYEAGDFSHALRSCDKLLVLRPDDQLTLETKIKILEEKGDWAAAYDILKRNRNLSKTDKQNRLAFYKVEEGRSMARLGKEHDARVRFREAIKQNSACAPAYLQISESYIRDGRPSDALNTLRKFVTKSPDQAYLAFDLLKQILFDIGHFGEIEEIYNQVLKVNPANIDARFALSSIFEKKGEFRRALELCQQILEYDPNNLEAKLGSVRFHSKLGHEDTALQISEEVIDDILNKKRQFECKKCGYIEDSYFWHCVNCGAWGSSK